MKKILVVVDMQNDFITGPLGTPEAVSIVDKVVEKIRGEEWDWIFVTVDTHSPDYLDNTQEGKKLPVEHCISGTDGWRLNSNIVEELTKHVDIYDEYRRPKIVAKDTFGAEELPKTMKNIIPFYKSHDYECTFIGVCTDICVISNALLLKAHYPEMRIVVDAACCAGTTPEKHRMALEVMKSCQIDILNEVSGDQVDVVNYIPDCGR